MALMIRFERVHMRTALPPKPSESSAWRRRCTPWRSVQDGHAEGGIGTERTAAQGGLRELVRLAEVLAGVRVVDAVMEARRSERVPGIDAERAAEGRARLQHFRSEERRVGKECRSRWSP